VRHFFVRIAKIAETQTKRIYKCFVWILYAESVINMNALYIQT